MPATIATGGQTRWKDSYASSPKVGLTVRANGEEQVQVYTPDRQLVPAGIAAPTVAPTVANGGAGSLGAGYVAYFYVYASSQYPFVEAITQAGGELWPKGNPSPTSAIFNIAAASRQNVVTVTKTSAQGIDKILIYRTPIGSDSATAAAYAAAGQAYYVGVVDNVGGGTTTFADNVVSSTEQMELDNYTAPQFWMCVYESPYWWGGGNPQYNVDVTLDGTSTFVGGPWFDGRNGQTVVFDGVSVGGFDSRGSFYFKALTSTTAQACLDAELTTPVNLPTGTTVARIRGFSGTLYRSKPNNPFAWGWTEDQITTSNGVQSIQSIPQQYAFAVGGNITALAVIATDRLLKLDLENPTRSYALNLSLAGTDGFEASLRTLDTRYSVSSHHAQIAVALPSGQSILRGLDVKQLAIVQGSSVSQSNASGEVYRTLRLIYTANDASRLYHAVYDASTELSVFWIKIAEQDEDLTDFTIDTAVCFHGPTGTWTTLDDIGVTASATIFDPVQDRTMTFLGTEDGRLLLGFDADEFGANLNTGAYTDNSAGSSGQVYNYRSIGLVVGNIGATIFFDNATGVTVAAGDTIRAEGLNYTVVSFNAAIGTIAIEGPLDIFLTPGLSVDEVVNGGAGVQLAGIAGQWLFLTDSDGRHETYARVATAGIVDLTTVFTFDRWIDASTDIAPTKTLSAIAAPYRDGYMSFALNRVDCRARTFYAPTNPEAKRTIEAWVTAQNAVDGYWPFQLRFYPELADATVVDVVELAQDTTPRGNPSTNWFSKTGNPSDLEAQFGVEVVQRGNDELRIHNFFIQEK